jgi:hypothetical protein
MAPRNEFEKAAAEQGSSGFLSDYWYFIRHNKKWWLGPIIALLLLLGALTLLGGTAAGPFIYTLF